MNVQKNTKNFMYALCGALLFITADREQDTGLTKLFQRPRVLKEKVTPENVYFCQRI